MNYLKFVDGAGIYSRHCAITILQFKNFIMLFDIKRQANGFSMAEKNKC